MANLLLFLGSPNGDRTRVFGVRGRYPRPLDDGTTDKAVVQLYVIRPPPLDALAGP